VWSGGGGAIFKCDVEFRYQNYDVEFAIGKRNQQIWMLGHLWYMASRCSLPCLGFAPSGSGFDGRTAYTVSAHPQLQHSCSGVSSLASGNSRWGRMGVDRWNSDVLVCSFLYCRPLLLKLGLNHSYYLNH
jgi:hypothetical protein